MMIFQSKQRKELYRALREAKTEEASVQKALEIGDKAAPWLVNWLLKGDPVKSRAIAALRKLDSDAVLEAIESKNRRIPYHYLNAWGDFYLPVIEVLKAIPTTRSATFLTELLKRSADGIAQKAAEALSNLGVPGVSSSIAEVIMKQRKFKGHVGSIMLGIFAFLSSAFLYDNWLSGRWHNLWELLTVEFWLALCCWFPYWIFTASNYRRQIVSVLNGLNDPASIGALALSAREKALRPAALEGIAALLEKVDDQTLILLNDQEMPAVLKLLEAKDDVLRRKMIEKLPYLGDETAVAALERFSHNPKQPAELRELAERTLPELRAQVLRRTEQRILLRAASNEPEENLLLRSASVIDDVADEQLLRPGVNG